MENAIAVITYDSEYFRTTARREHRYPLAWCWVKETLQNAVDAKSTEIKYTFDKRDKTFVVSDNGVGMDEKIILGKFLAIGGSRKRGNSVGGFGDAKKIICFAWDKWSLETNDCFLNESMIGREPVGHKQFSINGTRIKASLDECFDVDDAIEYLSMCEIDIPVTVTVINEDGSVDNVKPCKFVTGKPLDVLPFGEFYVGNFTDKSKPKSGLFAVRIHGMTMFYRAITNLQTNVILELTNLSSPKDEAYILNVQREALRWQEDAEVERVLDTYRSEPSSLKRDKSKNDNMISISRGRGAVASMESLMFAKQTAIIEVHGHSLMVPAALEKMSIDLFSNMSDDEFNEFLKTRETETPDEIPFVSENEIRVGENKGSVFADIFPFDFVIKGKPTVRYQSLKYKRLVLLWHKMIQYVIYHNAISENPLEVGPYNIGFVFPSDESVKAQYLEIEGTPTFLLNPNIAINGVQWRGIILEIMDRAAHEITHRWCPYHDGDFMEKYNKIKSVCYEFIDDFFYTGNLILKANKYNLVEAACLDENYALGLEDE